MAIAPPTTVTVATLAPRIGLTADDPEAARILALAASAVADALAGAWRNVPVATVDECVYRVARAFKDSTKKASTGAGQVTVTDGSPLRAPADPLVSALPIIRRYVVMGL